MKLLLVICLLFCSLAVNAQCTPTLYGDTLAYIQPIRYGTGDTVLYDRLVITDVDTSLGTVVCSTYFTNSRGAYFPLRLTFSTGDLDNYRSQGVSYLFCWIAAAADLKLY